jgi:flagellar biosynthesis protein FliR
VPNIITPEIAVRFILTLARVSGFIGFSPLLGSKVIPITIKAILSLFLAFMVFIVLPANTPIPHSIPELVLAVLAQITIGFLMGTAAAIIFYAIQSAGEIIDLQIGLSMASVVDPQSGAMVAIISRFYYFLAIMLFFSINGHHWLVLGVINSFKIIPLTGFTVGPDFIMYFTGSFSNILKMAFNASMPVIIAVLLVDVAAGFIARTAPRLNILILSMPFKIYLGFIMIIASLSGTIYIFQKWLEDIQVPLMRAFYL